MSPHPTVDLETINEHALTQEYGPKQTYGVEGPVPDDFRVQMGRAILAVAGADGVVSDSEMTFLLGRAKQFGISNAGIQAMLAFDYQDVGIEEAAGLVPRSLAKILLYDAILVARSDGFANEEREAARRWAQALELDPALVDDIELHLQREEEVRDARLKLLAP